MHGSLIPIGKMASINHITISTLRLYDKLGLLKPYYVDEETGYRYYNIHQNARLNMISYMKELGMQLSEISDLLEKEDITLIEDLLVKKDIQIHKQIEELEERHDAVERAIASIERYRKSPIIGTTSLEFIEARPIWGIACDSNFYENGLESYEKALIQLRESMINKNFWQIHSYNVGTTISKENYLNGDYIPDKVFVFLGHKEQFRQGTKMLESGMYACIYADDFDKELEYAELLKNYCAQHSYQISGDYICEVLTEFNVFDSNTRNMFMRLQVPIKFK